MRARTVRVDRWEKTPTRTAQDKIKIKNPGRQQPCWGSLFCTNLTQPTGNLDEATAAEITEILKESAQEYGKCVIIVTHSNAVAKAADCVLEIKGGTLKVRN